MSSVYKSIRKENSMFNIKIRFSDLVAVELTLPEDEGSIIEGGKIGSVMLTPTEGESRTLDIEI